MGKMTMTEIKAKLEEIIDLAQDLCDIPAKDREVDIYESSEIITQANKMINRIDRLEKLKKHKFKEGSEITLKKYIHYVNGNELITEYFLEEIKSDDKKLTETNLAKLGGTSVQREWTWHGGGGYYTWVVFSEPKFQRLEENLKKQGVKINLVIKDTTKEK